MKQEAYLRKLSGALRFRCEKQEIEEILEDYKGFFETGLSKGKTEDEIARELGLPRNAARSLIREQRAQPMPWIRLGALAGAILLAVGALRPGWFHELSTAAFMWCILLLPPLMFFAFGGRRALQALSTPFPRRLRHICAGLWIYAVGMLLAVWPVFVWGAALADWWVTHMQPLWRDILLALLRVLPGTGIAAVFGGVFLILARWHNRRKLAALYGTAGILAALIRVMVQMAEPIFYASEGQESFLPLYLQAWAEVALGLFAALLCEAVLRRIPTKIIRCSMRPRGTASAVTLALWMPAAILTAASPAWLLPVSPWRAVLRAVLCILFILPAPVLLALIKADQPTENAPLQSGAKGCLAVWYFLGVAGLACGITLLLLLCFGYDLAFGVIHVPVCAGIAAILAVQAVVSFAPSGKRRWYAVTWTNVGYIASAAWFLGILRQVSEVRMTIIQSLCCPIPFVVSIVLAVLSRYAFRNGGRPFPALFPRGKTLQNLL